MGNTFSDIVKFKKTWRPGQAALMAHLERDLADGSLRYVVAPGGGKKTVGLELIRRLDTPALILAPTQAEADEWRTRLAEDFLPEGTELKRWTSKDASVAAPIISMTYQGMHGAMNIGRPFVKWLRNAGVQTLCLDEPHHLRNEWWKMLEQIAGQMPELRILTLTSSEPVDLPEAEWERFAALCGPLDEAMEMPELVRENVLCPYQDYLYLCLPEEAEVAQLQEFRSDGARAFAWLRRDPAFLAAVQTHLGLQVPKAYEAFFRENQAYFMALLAFLKENGGAIPAEWLDGGAAEAAIPDMTVERMEVLLKGFLGYDRDSYEGCRAYQKTLEARLKEEKAVVRGKLDLRRDMDTERIFRYGHEKFAAVEQIVRGEQAVLGEELRMLVLTEHVKKEQMPSVGTKLSLKDIGAVPLFEWLRRAELDGIYMMVMTGTLMVIPSYLVPWFEEHTSLTWEPIKETGYSRLAQTTGRQEEAMKWMTVMFEEGYAQVLIATGAQLGGTWSCSRVNSLVFATQVGHDSLAHQLRAQAAMWDAERPDRVMNVWHVATVDPDMDPMAWEHDLKLTNGLAHREPNGLAHVLPAGHMTEDLAGVVRRLRETMSVQRGGQPRADQQVVSGFERVVPQGQRFDAAKLTEWNERELAEAAKREEVLSKWQEAWKSAGPKAKHEVVCVRDDFPKTEGQKRAVRGAWLCMAGIGAIAAEWLGVRLLQRFAGPWVTAVIYVALLAMLLLQLRNHRRVQGKKKTPEAWMNGFAQGVLEALQDGEVITSPNVVCQVTRDEHAAGGAWHLALLGAAAGEQEAFAACLAEFLGPVGEARYLILEQLADGSAAYYPVPAMFSLAKEDARLFYRNMNEHMGDVILVYTGADMGSESLKAARWAAYRNAGGQPVYVRKVM